VLRDILGLGQILQVVRDMQRADVFSAQRDDVIDLVAVRAVPVDIEDRIKVSPLRALLPFSGPVGDLTDRRQPKFREVRLRPVSYVDTAWAGDGEETFSVSLISANVEDRALILRSRIFAVISLHAVARWYQRSPQGDAALLSSLEDLIRQWPALINAGAEFDCRVRDGCWLGHVAESADAHDMLSLRTFIGAESLVDLDDYHGATTSPALAPVQ
jgi:hypothetical protein